MLSIKGRKKNIALYVRIVIIVYVAMICGTLHICEEIETKFLTGKIACDFYANTSMNPKKTHTLNTKTCMLRIY